MLDSRENRHPPPPQQTRTESDETHTRKRLGKQGGVCEAHAHGARQNVERGVLLPPRLSYRLACPTASTVLPPHLSYRLACPTASPVLLPPRL